MTISNSNLQSVFLASPDVVSDGAMAGQISESTIDPEAREQSFSEDEFWSMLSQQLSGSTTQKDSQAIENKDLFALFNAFKAELENSEDTDSMGGQWMQILKSHFSSAEEPEDLEPVSVAVNPSQMDAENAQQNSFFADLAVSEPEGDNILKNGDRLPRVRQVLSADSQIKPSINAQQRNQSKLDVIVKTGSINVTEGDSLNLENEVPDVLTLREVMSEEPVKEKLMLRQALTEQPAIQTREPSTTIQSQASQPISMIQQPQSSSQLPTALQSLQMSSQLPVTEWGNALGERVSFLINNKLNSAEIRIDPPHLGKLDIQIQIKEDSALVVINTQNAQAKELIESASVRLREFLQEAGYSSVDVNVSHREQSMEQGGFAGHDNSGSADDLSNQHNSTVANSEMNHAEMLIPANDGRIDYFA